MYQGTLVFAQGMAYLPLTTFRRCVAAHRGDHKVHDFVSGSVLRDGLCPADRMRVVARYRNKPACAIGAVLAHGLSLQDRFLQHASQCERDQTVADLRRLCSSVNGPIYLLPLACNLDVGLVHPPALAPAAKADDIQRRALAAS